ncbi:integrase [Pseudovibrio sp. WM33]|uniref:integrase n=1 Tax=Pseudovibrio sp. WM33 TaxID=1735585 RepID=UPI0007AE930B|nr:site-specific integrase [Pseudovibrio sp. WM33]KZL28357.1 Tyrosine recombinase XerC [Pseudovibrio sp. WM33]
MGTIVSKPRKDGSISHCAQILIKRKGKIVHRESKVFSRKRAAQAWLNKRETELSPPGGLEQAQKPSKTLGEVIKRYIEDHNKNIGRTKSQVLETIREQHAIADLDCTEIRSEHIVEFAKQLSQNVQPQTVGNYLSHLSAVFSIARAAWGYPLNKQVMEDAHIVCKRLGITSKSKQRERRPSLEELDKLLKHFCLSQTKYPGSTPMQQIIPFALFSTRRLDEICRLTWADFDKDHKRIWVRDMKHPGEKIGNDVLVDLPDRAISFLENQDEVDEKIFPYNPRTISTTFTRACKVLGIEDLHFHDLRHEGISILFESGLTIPHVAAVSGHRSWTSLKRYAHIQSSADKYEDWDWLNKLLVTTDNSTESSSQYSTAES